MLMIDRYLSSIPKSGNPAAPADLAPAASANRAMQWKMTEGTARQAATKADEVEAGKTPELSEE